MTPGPYREEASHSIRMRMADEEELQQQMEGIRRRRPAHGYRPVQELQGTAMAAPAA